MCIRDSDYTAFDVCGIEVRVLDDDLAEAIKYLSEKDREILLMYFFLGMSDTEIGDRLKTVSYTHLIIFAMFLPISFLLSMIPSYESMAKQAIVRVFNTIMTRAGITLIVTCLLYTSRCV